VRSFFTLLIIVGLCGGVMPLHSQTPAPCPAGQRPFVHARGESCLPQTPQRVAVLDLTVFELMLVTGIQPAVKSSLLLRSFYQRAHPELIDAINVLTADLPDIGFPPNFEVIASAQPDLIIGVDDAITADIYSQLSQIAPTVVLHAERGDWRTRLIGAGAALNIAEQVEALLAGYAAREEAFRQLVPDAGEIALSLVRTFPGQVGVMLTGSIADRVVRDVGLTRPEAQVRDLDFVLNQLGGRAELALSRETLRVADGDVIFVFGNPEELFADPLWSTLDAVQRGAVYPVGYYWYTEGLISAHAMLDDLFAHIAGTESAVPNPFRDGIPIPEMAG
jgi:iron complex transport system substrate-binding protein